MNSSEYPPKPLTLLPCGTRQTLSAPGIEFGEFGGSTACYGFLSEGRSLVLEAGFGLRAFPSSHWESESLIVISSLAWDHIQGIPFTPSVYNPKLKFRLVGPDSVTASFAQGLLDQQRPELCPVPDFYRDGIGADFQILGYRTDSEQILVDAFGQELHVSPNRIQFALQGHLIDYYASGFSRTDSASQTECRTALVGMPPWLEAGLEDEWLEICSRFLAQSPSIERLLFCNYHPWQTDIALAGYENRLDRATCLREGQAVFLADC